MDAPESWQKMPIDELQEEVWLLGQPSLSDYLNFVEETVIGGAGMRRSDLVDEWRRANDWGGAWPAADIPNL